MKTSIELTKAEISQAVADFVATKIGKKVQVDVIFNIFPHYDYADRLTGTHTITAVATLSEDGQP